MNLPYYHTHTKEPPFAMAIEIAPTPTCVRLRGLGYKGGSVPRIWY
ncbi:MAG: hypothetical protein RIM23_06865 [Coleofasciculus sp. G3-WIS-01]